MPTFATWARRFALLVLWMVVTAGMAFLVARTAADSDTVDVTAPLPPITAANRETVSLSQQTIIPVVSAAGSVVADGENYVLEARALTDDLAYRLLDPPTGVRALINGGPVGFTCEWVGIGPPGGQIEAGAGGLTREATNVAMRCRIPPDVRVVTGMSGTMVLQLGLPVDAMALPVSAVVGDAAQGQVVVVDDDGSTEVRTIQLGASDVYNMQVTDGLIPTERVLVAPTQSDLIGEGLS